MADVLERANLTSAKTAVVFTPERSLRGLMLQDELLRRGFDCLASEIRIEPASVREFFQLLCALLRRLRN